MGPEALSTTITTSRQQWTIGGQVGLRRDRELDLIAFIGPRQHTVCSSHKWGVYNNCELVYNLCTLGSGNASRKPKNFAASFTKWGVQSLGSAGIPPGSLKTSRGQESRVKSSQRSQVTATSHKSRRASDAAARTTSQPSRPGTRARFARIAERCIPRKGTPHP